MTYWEAAYILEHGSKHYEKVQEAETIALKLLKERIKKLAEAEDATFREPPKKDLLYGTELGTVIVDENVGG